MSWLILVLSGFAESIWALALGESDGFKKRIPTAIFVVFLALSMLGLAFAMTAIPTGTAYAVWTGIGASVTVVVSILRGKEKTSVFKILLLMLLIGCVVGLKAVA
ncbi:DMT family transporter [Arcanobacterium ihumii]|uniref:DMT family transporter n=1 Tax=Arcanobacterium ihumii TaxID=2138162 RepID=UPI000F533088|nr:multidrug efflux SMR transporter [Arcanobacterium ihumii]